MIIIANWENRLQRNHYQRESPFLIVLMLVKFGITDSLMKQEDIIVLKLLI